MDASRAVHVRYGAHASLTLHLSSNNELARAQIHSAFGVPPRDQLIVDADRAQWITAGDKVTSISTDARLILFGPHDRERALRGCVRHPGLVAAAVCACAACGRLRHRAAPLPAAQHAVDVAAAFAGLCAVRRACEDQLLRSGACDGNCRTMLGALASGVATSDKHGRADLQAQARAVVPVLALFDEARADQRKQLEGSGEVDVFDVLFAKRLLKWFKGWFKWVNSPKCTTPGCRGKVKCVGRVAPLPEERRGEPGVVELHSCGTCKATMRFPRYNHPGVLLETRRGRCGEWANCFALVCRSVGLRCRWVRDWTDHVWVEIFSAGRQRWLHADACERRLDRALMYEGGWKKKLSYCIAFGEASVSDVTQRYTRKLADVLGRRELVPEQWLADAVARADRAQRAAWVARGGDSHAASTRRALELAEFAEALNADNDDGKQQRQQQQHGGRESGDVEWRRQRGELGEQQARPLPGGSWKASARNISVVAVGDDGKQCILTCDLRRCDGTWNARVTQAFSTASAICFENADGSFLRIDDNAGGGD